MKGLNMNLKISHLSQDNIDTERQYMRKWKRTGEIIK
jgi:hypothetical protein